MTIDRIINIVVFGALFIYFLFRIFKKPEQKVDCGQRVKDLADKYGQSNLDSKTARDFYNYLQG